MAGGGLTLPLRQNLSPVQVLLGTCRETNEMCQLLACAKGPVFINAAYRSSTRSCWSEARQALCQPTDVIAIRTEPKGTHYWRPATCQPLS
jgi:hypothetical protein